MNFVNSEQGACSMNGSKCGNHGLTQQISIGRSTMLRKRLTEDAGPWLTNWGHAANASRPARFEWIGNKMLVEN